MTTEVLVLKPLKNRELLEFIQRNLECRGRLLQSQKGYLYLKVNDAFIHQLINFIDDPDKQIPDYFSPDSYTGAHISVAYPEEIQITKTHHCLNRTYEFKIGSFFVAEILDKIYFGCTVESRDLELIRRDLGLADLLNFKGFNVPFHFTIATKPRIETYIP